MLLLDPVSGVDAPPLPWRDIECVTYPSIDRVTWRSRSAGPLPDDPSGT